MIENWEDIFEVCWWSYFIVDFIYLVFVWFNFYNSFFVCYVDCVVFFEWKDWILVVFMLKWDWILSKFCYIEYWDEDFKVLYDDGNFLFFVVGFMVFWFMLSRVVKKYWNDGFFIE